MNRVTPEDDPSQGARAFSGLESWLMAVTLPTAATYRSLLNDPGASRRRAYVWVVVASWLPLLLTLRPAGATVAAGVGAVALDMATHVAAGLAGLVLLAAPTHLLCGLLGGNSAYARLEYVFAAWYAPLLLIAGLPLVRGAGVGAASPLAIYGVLLGVVSVRAVYAFGWGKALAGTLLWPAVVLLLLRQATQYLSL